VDHILEWVGHDAGGFFTVYNKETKTKTELPLPLRFAYLDTRKSVAGYYESVKRGFYSNEVKPFSSEPFDVKYYKDGNAHPVAKGTWSEIKGEIGAKGAKYCNNVYATLLDSTNEEIPGGSLVKLPLVGAAGSEWIDLAIADGESFAITGYDDRTKGRTKYRAPLFVKVEITDDEGAIADEQDAALQEFFGADKVRSESPSVAYTDDQAPAEAEVPEVDEDDIGF
jgi:hypothetical protein